MPAKDTIESLRNEIESELRSRAMLEHSIAELERTVTSLREHQEQIADKESADDEWRVRYYTQVEVNEQLERQRDWLKSKADAAKTRTHEGLAALLAELDLDTLTENQLMRYQKQLERDRNTLFNEMRDTEWKLDQESKTFHRFNDTRRAYMTELNAAMLSLESLRSQMKDMEMAETGSSIAKCPRHLKYLNISPDQRCIDPRKGPIRKTAAVRLLPKLETENSAPTPGATETEEVASTPVATE